MLKDRGLEVVDAKPGFTIGIPEARENIIFLTPSYGEDIGGLVFSYNSKDMLKESVRYYSKMNKDEDPPSWWIFKKDNIMLLISGRIPEENARKYEEALITIGNK
jgi:hypothetical protein